MASLTEWYDSGSAPHEALGRAARTLSRGGALYVGGGVGAEKRTTPKGDEYNVTSGGGSKTETVAGPLSAAMRAFTLAGASTDPSSPGGSTTIADPAVAARVVELNERLRSIDDDVSRYERSLARSKARQQAQPYSPVNSGGGVSVADDDAWEQRRIDELTVERQQVEAERAMLLAGGGLSEAADSLRKASTPEPLSRSKTSNWVARAGGLPAYIQHIAHDLMEKRGKSEQQAVQMAIGIVKRWARGGGNVDAGTKAAAAKAVAEWEALKGRSKAKSAGKAAGKVAESALREARALVAAADVAAGRIEVVGARAAVALAEGPEPQTRTLRELADLMASDLMALAAVGDPVGEAFAELHEREFSARQRKRAAASGAAMSDGSFPIHTPEDLANARRAVGRAPAGKRDAVRAHIRKRAKALGVKLSEVDEGVVGGLLEGAFEEAKHPRGKHGQFKAKIAGLASGARAEVAPGVHVTKVARGTPSGTGHVFKVVGKGRTMEAGGVDEAVGHVLNLTSAGRPPASRKASASPTGSPEWLTPARKQLLDDFGIDPKVGGGKPVRVLPRSAAWREAVTRADPRGLSGNAQETNAQLAKRLSNAKQHTVIVDDAKWNAREKRRSKPVREAEEPAGIGMLVEAFGTSSGAGGSGTRPDLVAQRQARQRKPGQQSSSGGAGRFDESKHKRGQSGTSEGGRFVSKGSSGEDVRAVQRRVAASPDGKFGSKTAAAVREFQQAHGLQVDGVIGHQTAVALAGGDGKAAQVGALKGSDHAKLKSMRRGSKGRSGKIGPRARGGVTV